MERISKIRSRFYFRSLILKTLYLFLSIETAFAQTPPVATNLVAEKNVPYKQNSPENPDSSDDLDTSKRFTEHLFKEICTHLFLGGFEFEWTAQPKPVEPKTKNYFSIWMGLEYLNQTGKTLKNKNRINIGAPQINSEIRQIYEIYQSHCYLKSKKKADETKQPIELAERNATPLDRSNQYSLEIRGAYFYPTEHLFRNIYPHHLFWGFELDWKIKNYFSGWIGAEYLNQRGKTTLNKNGTELTLIPINSGVKWIYNSRKLQPYLGVGFEATYVNEKTEDPTLYGSRSNWSWGGLFKTGFLLYLNNHFFFDFYADYSLRRVNLTTPPSSAPKFEVINSSDISGFLFGTGIGYGF